MLPVRSVSLALIAVAALALVNCGGGEDAHNREQGPDGEHEAHASHDEDGAHAHEAPNGGALVVLGDEHAHVELLLDEATGRLQLYALSAHADGPVRLSVPSIAVEIENGETAFRVELAAVASALTGETVGDTSLFEGQDDRLKGRTTFSGRLPEIDIRGGTYNDVAFTYDVGR